MKKILLTLTLFLAFFLNSQAQAPYWNVDTMNYFNRVQQAQIYYDSTGLDTVKGSGYKDFARWRDFYDKRIYADASGNSSITVLNQGIAALFNKSTCTNNLYQESWHNISHKNDANNADRYYGLGWVNSLCVDKEHYSDGSVIYAGSSNNGLFKTTNGNTTNPTWTCITDNTNLWALGINDIAVHPHPDSGDVIFIATSTRLGDHDGIGIGLIKTSNAGVSWSKTGYSYDVNYPNLKTVAKKIKFSSVKVNGNNIIYLVTKHKLLKSITNGASFTELYSSEYDLGDLLLMPGDNKKLFISVNRKDSAQIMYLLDDGVNLNWVNRTPTGEYNSFELSGTRAKQGYIGALGLQNFGNYCHSSDTGLTWTIEPILNHFGGFGKADLVISNFDEKKLIIGGVRLQYSINEGNTFILNQERNATIYTINTEVHPDTRDLEIFTIDSSNQTEYIYSANDGGVDFTSGFGNNWYDKYGTGLNITEIFAFDFDVKRNHLLYATQDNGMWHLNNGQFRHLPRDADGIQVYCEQLKEPTNYFLRWNTTGTRSFNVWRDFADAPTGRFSWISANDSRFPWRPRTPIFVDDGSENLYCGFDDKLIRLREIHTRDSVEALQYGHAFPSWVNNGRRQGGGSEIVQDFSVFPIDTPIHRINAIGICKMKPSIMYVGFDEPSWGSGARLFKTSSALADSAHFINITNNIPVNDALGISDIVVHPFDSNIVWVCYGSRFDANNIASASNNKIFLSTDGGNSFSVLSSGLTFLNGDPMVFPITQLVFDEYSEVLYAATDVGVYMNPDPTNSSSSWYCFNKDMPISIVTDVKIDYCNRKLLASTYGRGLWECNLPDLPKKSFTIGENHLLNIAVNEVNMHQTDIVIPSGRTFTVEGTLKMGPNTSITIKPGAKLSVIGGLVTSVCDQPWNGIIVEGTGNQSPYNLSSHGRVNITNGGIVENAYNAISLIGRDANGNVIWSTTGGQVLTNNATFRNNKRDVEFMSYNPKNNSGIIYSNISSFTNTTFETTDNTLFPASDNKSHVTMYDVSGVKFSGCNFIDKRTKIVQNLVPGIDITEREVYGKGGIFSIESSYSVIPSYSTNGSNTIINNSSFDKLKYGIRSYNDGRKGVIKVEKALFNCNKGAYFNGINSVIARADSFTITSVSNNSGGELVHVYGLYLDKSTLFNVEGNVYNGDISTPTAYHAKDAGLVIRNGGEMNQEFYRSTFNDLRVGAEPLSNNRLVDGTTGLYFRCNTFNNHYDEVYIRQDQTLPSNLQNLGVAKNQGNGNLASDNAFDNYGSYLNMNIENAGNPFAYYHRNAQVQNNQYYPDTVTTDITYKVSREISSTPLVHSENCKDKLPSYGTGIIGDVQTDVINKRNNLIYIHSNRNAVLDGGNTNGIIYDIENVTTGTISVVYNNLINLSPNLSEPVLSRVANAETPFTHQMIRDVLIANPHSSRSLWILETLENRTNPLTSGALDSIKDQVSIYSSKDTLDMDYSIQTYTYDMALNELIYMLKSDTNLELSDLEMWMKHPTNPNYHYQLAELYFTDSDWNGYAKIADSIPLLFNTTEYDTSQHNSFIAFYSEVKNWLDNGDVLYEPNAGKKSWLLQFASQNKFYPSKLNALLAVNDTFIKQDMVYHPESTPPVPFTSSIDKLISQEKNNELLLYPNPASKSVRLDLKNKKTNAVIRIYTLQGKLISQIQWTGSESISINTQYWPEGSYLLIVNQDEQEKLYKKVQILKK